MLRQNLILLSSTSTRLSETVLVGVVRSERDEFQNGSARDFGMSSTSIWDGDEVIAAV